MFTIDTNIKSLKDKEKNLVKAFFSMNTHQVADPEMQLQDARSYALFYRETLGSISVYIDIHFLENGRELFYSHSSNPFPDQDLVSIEEETRNFIEGLGAVIDEIDFTRLPDAERSRWIAEHDSATAPTKSEASASPIAVPTERTSTSVPTPPQTAPSLPEAQSVQQTFEVPLVPEAPAVPVVPEAPAVPVMPEAPAIPTAPEAPPVLTIPAPTVHKTAEITTPASPETASTPSGLKTASSTATRTPPAPASAKRAPVATSEKKSPQAKPAQKQGIQPATGMVSRDREALARLLASF